VITGTGVRTPAGGTVRELLDALFSARSTATTVPALVEAGVPVTFGACVPQTDDGDLISTRESWQLGRPARLALVAALEAMAQAGLASQVEPGRTGVCLGTGIAGLGQAEEVYLSCEGRWEEMPRTIVPKIMIGSPAAWISRRVGARGPCLTYSAACASGTIAIGEAVAKIRNGVADVMIAGGVDAGIIPILIAAFSRIGALSERNDDPVSASRPFAADRDGFVMGEGAGFLILEGLERARARGAEILGEVVGYAATSDAFHVLAPRADGSGAAGCILATLDDAGLQPGDLGHVNANATSTPAADRAEALAMERALGRHCPPVTAPKGVLGHLVGAAGAVEAIASLAFCESGKVAPTANVRSGDVIESVDLVLDVPRTTTSPYALSNSFGFGGQNACLILTAGEDPRYGRGR
jgi:3-oxoacyl-[acyl-carrier-protein] synthase II